MVKHSLINN